ncbi:transglutaminase-like domain-containing protein [Patescibacteria group bacterium]|nr:transglutaminase-like domain-containing protein [Patescibacteria group bacterium]
MKKQDKQFNLSYKLKFDHKNNNQIKFWFAKPVNNKYQKIINFSVSHGINRKYNDKQENEILYFDIKDKKDFIADLSVRLSKDTKLVNKNWSTVKKSEYKKYLKSELFLEQTPAIKKLTNEITKDKKTLPDKVKAIFDFVVDNFSYQYPVKNRGVKNLNLKNLRGDCGEYSALMVAMLRILGVPAKNQTGFVIYPKYKKVLEHAWLSACLGKAGWLDFDPQYAAIEKNKAKYFGQRNDYRIVFTNGYNIPLKPGNKSVQVLQPVVCGSKVRFRNKFVSKNKIQKTAY